MKIIIGSTALKHHFPDFPRTPKDLDYAVSNSSKYKRQSGVEYLENPVLLKYCNSEFISPELLLTLKMSHLFWNINWEKHMWDVQFLLGKSVSFSPEIMDEFIEYWKTVHPKVKRSDLEMSKEDFFNNAVNENINEHDYLHTLLAEIPAYTRILKDECEVELDENKWQCLSYEEKCDVVVEEACVMAIERYPDMDYRRSYKIQLKDNIIKHYPKFIAIFAIQNYKNLEKPKFNFKKKIENELQEN